MYYESKTFNNYKTDILNEAINNSEKKYRKELIMAKIIISELQDTIEILNQEKKELESKLEENLNNYKIINSDYLSLIQKFNDFKEKILLEANNKENNYLIEIKELKLKIEELNEEIETKKGINKIKEEALEKKISLLEKKLEKTEEELINTKKSVKLNKNLEKNNEIIDKENNELREDNINLSNKFNEEIKKTWKELEYYKNIVKRLENENFLIKNELNENKIILEKEQKINWRKNQLDKNLNDDIEMRNKYISIKKQYDILLKGKNELDKKYNQRKLGNKNSFYLKELELTKEQNKYILNLLLKITPNPKLIKQIIELNKEIIQLERKKISIMNNKNQGDKLNNIKVNINEQINKFKNNLNSLETELIKLDFGSSYSY